MKAVLALVLCLSFTTLVAADHWAVLVAGSNGFWNYRHQADVCHAYHVLRSHGIAEDHIITFQFDDIANDPSNPFPGQVFNKPSTGAGVDVYAGCGKDYTGSAVNSKNFLNVLNGDEAAMKGIGSGKVLKSTAEDKVFIFFSDHGATGLIAFPSDYLYAADLMSTLKAMHTKNAYKELVFYLEACESGSMFEGLLDNNMNIFVTTASNADESSWGTYCGNDAMVNGKNIGSCLGDLYSVNWMEDSDAADLTSETLDDQFQKVKTLTAQSHVMEYGQLDLGSRAVAEFQGTLDKARIFRSASKASQSTLVNSRDAKLQYFYHLYTNLQMTQAHSALSVELAHRKFADDSFSTLANLVYPSKGVAVMADKVRPRDFACLKSAVSMVEYICGKFSDYSLKYVRLLSHMCEHGVAVSQIISGAKQACKKAEL
eukprot:GILK01001941.1.p1 GENE.GILK01001941.1~~GILK01001941.1.p1  ORF type:complete len:428 (-),score=77.81 GILK01001941.1:221-1504(-)